MESYKKPKTESWENLQTLKRLNSTLLNKTQRRLEKFESFEIKTTYQILWDAVKEVLRREFIALNLYTGFSAESSYETFRTLKWHSEEYPLLSESSCSTASLYKRPTLKAKNLFGFLWLNKNK